MSKIFAIIRPCSRRTKLTKLSRHNSAHGSALATAFRNLFRGLGNKICENSSWHDYVFPAHVLKESDKINYPRFYNSYKTFEFKFSFRHDSGGSIFFRRNDYSAFNVLPRQKINSYHIKVNGDFIHKYSGVFFIIFLPCKKM